MWLKQLKIAIVEKNTEKLSELMENLPELTTQEDLDSAVHLLAEATKFMTELRDETKKSMIQMKKNIKFLKVTQTQIPSKLDIKS